MSDTTVLTPHQRAARTRALRRYRQRLAQMPAADRAWLDAWTAEQQRDAALHDELVAVVTDPDLDKAVWRGVWWARRTPTNWSRVLRDAIVGGGADDCDTIRQLADHLADEAAALHALIDYTESHHPRARRRAQRRRQPAS
jgi:hypothetical protein